MEQLVVDVVDKKKKHTNLVGDPYCNSLSNMPWRRRRRRGGVGDVQMK